MAKLQASEARYLRLIDTATEGICTLDAEGSDLWTIVSTNPILDETGEFLGMLAMMTDVTDPKRAEEECALVWWASSYTCPSRLIQPSWLPRCSPRRTDWTSINQ